MVEPSRQELSCELIRIFLLIENRLVRETLVRVLRKRADLCVVGSCPSAELTSAGMGISSCDVLLSDCRDLIASVRDEDNSLKSPAVTRSGRLVLLDMDEDEQQFLSAVRAGARGYLLRDASPAEVVTAVRLVARGEGVCPPRLCYWLMEWAARHSAEIPNQFALSKHQLTLRQQKLISLVAIGLTNKEIAARLNLSEFTVKNHIHRILKQLEASTRYEAVQAIRAMGRVLPA